MAFSAIGILTPEETVEFVTAPCGRSIPTCAPEVGSGLVCGCGEVHDMTDRRRVLAMLAAFGRGQVVDPERTRRLMLRTLEVESDG